MRRVFLTFTLIIVACGVAFFFLTKYQPHIVSPLGQLIEKPLDKYTIANLMKRQFVGSAIILDEAVATTSAYTAYRFHFVSDGKKVTGLAYIPASDTGNQTIKPDQKKFPAIVQFRGFVEREKYTSGEGTKRSSEVFAANGFITLAPDFLGYGGPASPERQRGGSASPSADVFEERFETYTTALNLIASVGSLSRVDPSRVGIWGHSNGGQIALTVLEIFGKPIPTTLWAPVSKPFPYSILYYTDDFDDHGKALRRRLSKFENDYDVEQYSFTNYVDRINGPLQIHQGTTDEAVPQKWSDDLVKVLKDKRKDATNAAELNYFIYPGGDHNLMPGWNLVVSRDVAFFRKYFQ